MAKYHVIKTRVLFTGLLNYVLVQSFGGKCNVLWPEYILQF